MSANEKDLINLTEKEILELDNSVKVRWARDLGLYYGRTDTPASIRAIDYELLKSRRELLEKVQKKNPDRTRIRSRR